MSNDKQTLATVSSVVKAEKGENSEFHSGLLTKHRVLLAV